MADDSPGINLDDIDFGPTLRGLQKGDRVFDRFVLQKLLGRGGMGVVWLALDERLRREVALKFAPEVIRYDDAAVEELKEETCKGLVLSHPNIVKTFDFLLDETNAAISMEYIDGESLSAMRIKQPRKVFEVREIQRWVSQLLTALEYAHQQVGMIHRDLKPANLMVDRAGNLKVTDFGIARSITDALSRATLMDGNSTGTLAYMSPQQAEGRRPQISDDLYAFGSTLYELLTGKPPFFSGNIGLQLRVEAPVSLSQRREEFGLKDTEAIPANWEETLLACLDKDPQKRPASAAEIESRLAEVVAPRSLSFTVTVPVKSAPASTDHSEPEPTTDSVPASESKSAHHTPAPVVPPPIAVAAPPPLPAASSAAITPPGVSSAAIPPVPTPFPLDGENATSSVNARESTSYTQAANQAFEAPADEYLTSSVPNEEQAQEYEHEQEELEQSTRGGSGWLWAAVIMILLGIGTMGAAGWWLYQNTPFFKGKGEVVKQEIKQPLIAEEEPPKTPLPEPAKLDTPKTSDEPVKQDVVMVPKEPKTEPTKPKPEDMAKPEVPDKKPETEPKTEEPKPAKFTTIQNAIRQAKSGTEIVIPEGVYNEQVRLQSGIRLVAASPGKVTIQTDGKSGPALLAEDCKNASLAGIVFQHTGSEVVQGESWPVVFIKGSSVTVENCIIQSGVGDGMIIAGTEKTVIKQSRFISNAGNGLVLESGTQAVITDCESLTNGMNGVSVQHTGTAPVLTGCTLKGNIGSGAVVIDGASVTFGSGTLAKGNNEAGLAADGEGVILIVTEATIEENQQGINLSNDARGEIRKTQITHSAEAGLVFNSADDDTILEGNTLEKNKGDGIHAVGEQGDAVKIFNNKITGNAFDGILILGTGFKPELTGNNIVNNAQNGIHIAEGAAGVIRDNTLKGNKLGAIATSDAGPDIVIGTNQIE